MAALEQQYVNHLRKAARSNETYVCVLCNHRIANAGKQAFVKHLDSAHSDEAEVSSKEPSFNLTTWQNDLETRSRAAGSSSLGPEVEEPSPSRGYADTTQAMNNLALDSKKRPLHRKIAPATSDMPPAEPGGHKRSRSSDEHNQRASNRQSKSQNPRRAVPKGEENDPSHQLTRAGTFQSNWGTDGQPTRILFNPADVQPPPAGLPAASQATKPSRSTGQSSNARQQTPSLSASASTQPAQSNQERGILPMPVISPSTRERAIAMPIDPRWPEMLLQPDSRPISQEQLAAEVKSIYAGLTMVESKCIHVDKAQTLAMKEGDTKILNDHWQALIALHKTLLHEHHDFFLASQHPSASPALQRLAEKYSMPARMWKHGIHSFLELLRYRLPESLEFMISFIYTAYQMMSLLYETVPAFKNTWIECLGDLGRYRMAIEDEDIRDRENWANVSRFWYTKAADNTPDVGRLYHHLAILARPNVLQQLSLYARSLISVNLFAGARESILTLFKPFLNRPDAGTHVSQLDKYYIEAHALLFNKERPAEFKKCEEGFLELLDQHIGRVTAKWREQGAWVMIALLGALFDYGNDSPLRRAFELGFHKMKQQTRAVAEAKRSPVFNPQQPQATDGDTPMEDAKSVGSVDEKTQRAWDNSLGFTIAITSLVLRRQGDKNVLPFVHILLGFLLSLSQVCSVDAQIETSHVATSILRSIPRKELCAFLNTLARSEAADPSYESNTFIRPEKGELIPLPEDHLIRGQVWSQDLFPSDLFKGTGSDDEEKNIEHASTVRMRADRVLNIGYQLAQRNIGIRYDTLGKSFSYDQSIATTKHTPALQKPVFDPEDVRMMMPAGGICETDSTYESDEDAEENKTMKRVIDESSIRSPEDSGHLVVPPSVNNHLSAIRLVCDEQVVLHQQDFIQILAHRQFTLVVPDRVVHELASIIKSDPPTTNTEIAHKAMEGLKVVHKTTKLEVLDAQGNDLADKHFGNVTAAEVPFDRINKGTPKDPQKELLDIVQRAKELSLKSRNNASTFTANRTVDSARPALLLTEDKRTRVTAAKGSLSAASPSVLGKYLDKLGTQIKLSSKDR